MLCGGRIMLSSYCGGGFSGGGAMLGGAGARRTGCGTVPTPRPGPLRPGGA
jgi:hypothetical protein